MQRMRHQMGIKERMKLNTPATESTPPAREVGVGSHRDGIEMGARRFAPSNHGLHYLPTFMAMFAFSHASFHAKLRFSAVFTLEKPVSE